MFFLRKVFLSLPEFFWKLNFNKGLLSNEINLENIP